MTNLHVSHRIEHSQRAKHIFVGTDQFRQAAG